MTRFLNYPWASRLVLLAFASMSQPNATTAFFLNPPKATNIKPASVDSSRLRIRTAREEDLAKAAVFLSTASTPDRGGWFSLSYKLDQMFAQSDIEELLKGRCRAIEAGKSSFSRAREQLIQRIAATDVDGNQVDSMDDVSDQLLLQYWWNHGSTGTLKTLIQKAAACTGENNVWCNHNFALTPWCKTWFQHIQMAAEDPVTGEIIGFCEIALLENPLASNDDPVFALAISNLATSPAWRRRGVATRLLQSAQRYARRQWQADSLGLYVDQENEAAVKLYEKMGYQKTVTCSSLDCTMWYMVKALSREDSQASAVEHVHDIYEECNST
jgi:ribosomal protein S18 acetylase RimI-like enzyme